jgi:hypothetical protein
MLIHKIVCSLQHCVVFKASRVSPYTSVSSHMYDGQDSLDDLAGGKNNVIDLLQSKIDPKGYISPDKLLCVILDD